MEWDESQHGMLTLPLKNRLPHPTWIGSLDLSNLESIIKLSYYMEGLARCKAKVSTLVRRSHTIGRPEKRIPASLHSFCMSSKLEAQTCWASEASRGALFVVCSCWHSRKPLNLRHLNLSASVCAVCLLYS